MKGHKFIDSSGVVIVEMSTDIPGLTITPPGFKSSDAQVMTAPEIEQLAKRDKARPLVTGTIDTSGLQTQIDALTKAVSAIQDTLQKLTNKTKP